MCEVSKLNQIELEIASLKLFINSTVRAAGSNSWDRGQWVPQFRKVAHRLENGIWPPASEDVR